MKSTALFLVVLFSSIMFSKPLNGDENKNVNSSELVEKLVSIVIPILQGKDYTEFKENISPEAYVINNNSYESIFEVLGNSAKKEKFIEGKEVKFGFAQLLMLDDSKEIYLILETKNGDDTKTCWHSILFKIGDNQKWRIISWHKS